MANFAPLLSPLLFYWFGNIYELATFADNTRRLARGQPAKRVRRALADMWLAHIVNVCVSAEGKREDLSKVEGAFS